MAFDPSVISQIPDGAAVDPSADKAKALTLADLYDQNTLNKAKVAGVKQDQSDMTYARQILAGKDLSKLDDQDAAVAQITKRSPKLGMDLMKSFQSGQQAKTENELSQVQLAAAKNDVIGGAVVQLKQKHDQLIAQGMNEQQVHDAMKDDLFGTLKSLNQATLPNGQPLLTQANRDMIKQNFQNGYNPQAIDSLVSQSQTARATIAQQMKERDETRKDKDEDRKERATNAAISTGQARTAAAKEGALEPEDVSFMAQQYLAGDKSVMQNLGRGAQGAKNIIELRRGIRTEAEAQGLKPADVAARLAEFNGYVAEQRTIGTQTANVQMAAGEAKKMIANARELSAKVPRETSVHWNKFTQMKDTELNDPDLIALKGATAEVINTWARAINPKGVATVEDKKHGYELLSQVQNQAGYAAQLDQFENAINASLAAPPETKQYLHDIFLGKKPSAPGAQPAAPSPASGKAPGGGDHPPPPPGFVVQ